MTSVVIVRISVTFSNPRPAALDSPSCIIRLLPSRRVNGLNPITEGGLECLRLFPFLVALVGACPFTDGWHQTYVNKTD